MTSQVQVYRHNGHQGPHSPQYISDKHKIHSWFHQRFTNSCSQSFPV